MQVTPLIWKAISDPRGIYYDDPIVVALRNTAKEFGADLEDKFDPYANAAVGIAHYAKWQTYQSFGNVMSQVVNHYGEGANLNKGLSSRNPYPILAPSTLEILYYRDILAQADNREAWYIDVLYDERGNQLTNTDPLFD
ncbi:MAG: hypothetical protein IJ412_05475 [Oscillospiraceae bacterium]|nr:hypothetical protein [Oscillospiraceae bacterium]